VRVTLEDHSIECEIQLIYLTDGTADQLYLKYTSEEEI
jgi:hypothetical protein